MNVALHLRRFVQVLLGAFVIIAGSHLLRGRGLPYALGQGAFWAAITACVFTVSSVYRARKGQRCALCGDTAEPGETPAPR
jgi:hypothetical protein